MPVYAFILLFLLMAAVLLYAAARTGVSHRREQEKVHGAIRERFRRELPPEMAAGLFPADGVEAVPGPFRGVAALLQRLNPGNVVTGGNGVEIITTGARKRELLLEDLRRARHSIHIQYFRFAGDKAGREVSEILLQKVAEGVQVRLIYPNMSNRDTRPAFYRSLERGGMEVLRYMTFWQPPRTFFLHISSQCHRKIVVIDGKVAYTGGMNLNDNYFYRWRDTHMRITGAAVARLQASFLDTWLVCGRRLPEPLGAYFTCPVPVEPAPLEDVLVQSVPDAPEYRWPAMQMAYGKVLREARDYVWLQTPYFVPPKCFLRELKAAAERGVDVRLMLPEKVDTLFFSSINRTFYLECLRSGVKIFHHRGVFIHAKTLVADDALAIIGATNLDERSFRINNELSTLLYGREAALTCKDIFLADAREAVPVMLEEWERSYPSPWTRFFTRVVRFFRSLL